MNNLKPCPFCGTEAALLDAGEVGNPLSIECETEWCIGHTDLYPRDSKDKLIKQWNERKLITDDLAKDIATEFYYHWHNSKGTNTAQGFDDWWKLNKIRFGVEK